MIDETKANRVKIEWFRVITPVLVTVSIFIAAMLLAKVDKIDDRMFHHFTNDEIHVPREYNVSQAEFDMYAKFANQERTAIIKAIDKICDRIK